MLRGKTLGVKAAGSAIIELKKTPPGTYLVVNYLVIISGPIINVGNQVETKGI